MRTSFLHERSDFQLVRSLLSVLVFLSLHAEAQPSKYTFTTDWFSDRIESWKRILKNQTGKPSIRYLEIGVFEGRSFFWVLDNVLTHPTSKAYAVDKFEPLYSFSHDFHSVFLANLKKSGHSNRVKVFKGDSSDVLKGLPKESFDIVYIDGDHRAFPVLRDAVLSWDLLKNNGILIFDDYSYYLHFPLDQRPRAAIDLFVTSLANSIKILERGNQLILQKLSDPCLVYKGDYCSVFGGYLYRWFQSKLFTRNKRFVFTNRKEQRFIRNLLRERPLGETEISIEPSTAGDPVFNALARRLNLTVKKNKLMR
jgi:hypothetical protein